MTNTPAVREDDSIWLDRAYEQRDGGLSEIKGAPLLKGLESDPRYRELLTRLKLPN